MISRLRALLCLLLAAALTPIIQAQSIAPAAQATISTEGLRSSNANGSFKGAVRLPDDTLVLLYDQGDGLRLLKTDRRVQSLLAEAHQGTSGDSGLSITADPSGNIYIAGTSTSGTLAGTPGAAFLSATDASSNPFIAAFDPALHLTFLTFLGVGRTSVAGIAATTDAVFVTGTTFSSAFPVTPGTLHSSAPANLASGAGYVVSFTQDGAALRYGTFLDGLVGGTTPAAIAADSNDTVFVAGSTSDQTFPTLNALQPLTFAPVSGFVSKLSPTGQSLLFSTFLPGSGVSSLALDSASSSLLLTGNINPGQFPILQAPSPITVTPYQSLIRLSTDGQALLDSILLVPGTASFVTPGSNGTAWVSGSLTSPLGPAWQDHGVGDAFVLHLTTTDQIDQAIRLGGNPASNSAYATLSTTLNAPILSADDTLVTVPGTVAASIAASLRFTQSFDLALAPGSSTLLPSDTQDLLPSACPSGSECSGSAGLLTQIELTAAQASLALSTDDLPSLILRNTGAIPATAVQVTASGLTSSSNCPQTLPAFAQCAILLSGSGPGTLSVTAANAPALIHSIPTLGSAPPTLAFDTPELDFGLVVPSTTPVSRTITVMNLSSVAQTFASAADGVPSTAPYVLSELASSCSGPATAHVIPAQATCTITVGVSFPTSINASGPVHAYWRLGTRELPITGFIQASSLSVSSTAIDFGPQPTAPTPRLPRLLYLSNAGSAPIPHAPVILPANSPFTLLDGCPPAIGSGTICPLTLTYNPSSSPSFDAVTLTLDQGITVVVTGEALATPPGLITSPALIAAAPSTVTFASPVQVTRISAEMQTVRITNPGALTAPVSVEVLGDFLVNNGCGTTLSPGSTCSLVLSFAPTQPGTRAGLLTIATQPGAAPTYIPLTGAATAIVDSANGTLDLGTTTVLEPTVSWRQIQGTFSALSATVSNPDLSLALLADDGSGHGTLPPSAFSQTASAPCSQCWLAVQYIPHAPGSVSTNLQITSASGQPYTLALTGQATPADGLILAPGLLTLPATPVGKTSAPLALTLTNLLSPSAPARVQQVSATGDFTVAQNSTSATPCQGALQPTAACAIQVTFSPSTTGLRTGTLTVTSLAGSVTTSLQGVASPATAPTVITSTPDATTGTILFPTQADFGLQSVGTLSQLRQFTITNASTSPATLTLAADRNFPLAQAAPCTSVAPAASCTFSVAFAPETAGSLTGTVTLTTTPAGSSTSTQTVLYLRGFGTSSGKLTVSAGSDPTYPIDSGPVVSGNSAAQSLTLTNAGIAPLNIRRVTSTYPFRLSTDCLQSLSPGGSCQLRVTYNSANQLPPSSLQVSRVDHGTLLIETDAEESPATVYVTGTALPSSADPGPQWSAIPVYSLSASAVTFPNTLAGSVSSPQTVTFTNTGTVPVSVLGLLTPPAYTASTTCATVQPGANCSISIAFSPQQDTPNPSLDTLGLLTDAATALDYISLVGPSSAAEFHVSPGSLTFAPTSVGSTAKFTGTLTNTAPLPITLSAALPSGDFTLDAETCGSSAQISLVAGQSCTFTVTFTPTASGMRNGTLTFTGDTPESAQSINLLGTGLSGSLQANPTQLDFGNVPLTTSATSALALSNSGNAPLGPVVVTLSGPDANAFAFSSSCPLTGLDPSASCQLQITFTPPAQGTRIAALSITSTDPKSPLIIPVTGTGTQPPGFTLTVNGNSAASATMNSGDTAPFPLTVTAQGGYTGTLTLACTPVTPAANAGCSIADSSLDLEGTQATSTASINTRSGVASSLILPLLLSPAGLLLRGTTRRRKAQIIALVVLFACFSGALLTTTGCGHGPGYTRNPYTPPGTYQYQVTATSTSGTPLSSSVTLTVIVH